MAKWQVRFDVRKGNSSMSVTENVNAETESAAIAIAEQKSRRAYPNNHNQDYEWNLISVKEV
ncbi:hypothetical protein Q4S27_16580 [Morganella morganii subsp. sibonii]